MADRNLSLGVDIDEATLSKAKKRLQELEAAEKKLAAEFITGAKGIDKFTDELADNRAELLLTRKVVQALDKDLDKLEEPRKLDIKNQRLDKVTKDVGSIGDVDSAFATFASATGSQELTGIADIFAVGEQLPRLSAAMSALPSAIGAAVTALGPLGIGLTVIAGIALIAVGKINAEAEKQAREIGAAIDSLRDREQKLAEGFTTKDITVEIDNLQKQRDAEVETLKRLESAYKSFEEQGGVLADVAKLTSHQEEELANQLNKSREEVTHLDNTIEGWENSLGDSRVALNDLIAVEKERLGLLLTEANQTGQLVGLRLRATELTREQIDSELKNLDVQQQVLQAEIAALQASGDTSETVTERIDQLTQSLEFLGQQSDVLRNASTTAQSEREVQQAREETVQVNTDVIDAEKRKAEATRKAEERTRQLEQAQQQAAQAQQQYTQAISNAKTALKNAVEDIDQDLADSLDDTRTDKFDDLADLERDFHRDELSALRAHKRSLSQINDASDKAETDAIRQRDFAQLAQSRDDKQDQLEAEQDELEEAGHKRLIEAQNQHDDILEAERRTTRDLNIEAQRRARDAQIQRDRAFIAARQQLSVQDQAQRASLQGMQQYWKEFLTLQQSATRQSIRGGGTSASSDTIDSRLESLTSRPQFGAT